MKNPFLPSYEDIVNEDSNLPSYEDLVYGSRSEPSTLPSYEEIVASPSYDNPDFPRSGVINNPDGSISTHKMMYGQDSKGWYAFPSIIQENGKLKELSGKEADAYAHRTGKLKRFDTRDEASTYAAGSWKNPPVTPQEIFEKKVRAEDKNLFSFGGRTPLLGSILSGETIEELKGLPRKVGESVERYHKEQIWRTDVPQMPERLGRGIWHAVKEAPANLAELATYIHSAIDKGGNWFYGDMQFNPESGQIEPMWESSYEHPELVKGWRAWSKAYKEELAKSREPLDFENAPIASLLQATGEQSITFAAALGMSVATGSMVPGLLLLGGVEASGSYWRSEDYGVPFERQFVDSLKSGGWEIATEIVPFHYMMKGKFLTAGLWEAVQEKAAGLGQTFWDERNRLIYQEGWDEEEATTEAIKVARSSSWLDFFVGGLLGTFGAGAVRINNAMEQNKAVGEVVADVADKTGLEKTQVDTAVRTAISNVESKPDLNLTDEIDKQLKLLATDLATREQVKYEDELAELNKNKDKDDPKVKPVKADSPLRAFMKKHGLTQKQSSSTIETESAEPVRKQKPEPVANKPTKENIRKAQEKSEEASSALDEAIRRVDEAREISDQAQADLAEVEGAIIIFMTELEQRRAAGMEDITSVLSPTEVTELNQLLQKEDALKRNKQGEGLTRGEVAQFMTDFLNERAGMLQEQHVVRNLLNLVTLAQQSASETSGSVSKTAAISLYNALSCSISRFINASSTLRAM
jgi:hypothetical protein